MKKCKTIFKQFLLIVLSALMIFSNAAIANGAVNPENEIAPYYVVINSSSISFSISGIKASCSASIVADYSTSLKIKMELQKKKSGAYSTIETWTSSKTGVSLAISKTRNINVLCNYRLKVTYTAGSETTTAYKYA